MRFILCLVLACVFLDACSAEQQRILRRVIKSTPTATNLARVRMVAIRSTASEARPEKGAVTELSGKEAATFGTRNNNETTASIQQQQQVASGALKTARNPASSPPSSLLPSASSPSSSPSSTPRPSQPSTSTTIAPQTTSITESTTTTTSPVTSKTELKHKASERQQNSADVEVLMNSPSWQTMTAVEAPAAMLIAAGARRASSSDLSSSASSQQLNAEASESAGDFLRSSAVKGAAASYQESGETFSRLRQQTSTVSKTSQQQQQQQTFYYPPQSIKTAPTGKTVRQETKTHWYQPAPTTTTARPAPIIQEQHYEQQHDNYVEQQTAEYSAPIGMAEPFAFDFRTEDNKGNGQYRKEESDKNGVVHGSYGYTDANGIYRHVEYVADQNGFRANIKSNEPGLIGETQPASILLAKGEAGQQAAPAAPRRLESPPSSPVAAAHRDNNDWTSSIDHGASADLALTPPEFESSHKPESWRARRHFRN